MMPSKHRWEVPPKHMIYSGLRQLCSSPCHQGPATIEQRRYL